MAPGFDVGFDEGVQAGGGEVRDPCQAQATGSAVVHLHRRGDEHLAVGARYRIEIGLDRAFANVHRPNVTDGIAPTPRL